MGAGVIILAIAVMLVFGLNDVHNIKKQDDEKTPKLTEEESKRDKFMVILKGFLRHTW